MTNISYNDIIVASISVNGSTIASQCLSGVTDVNDVMRVMRHYTAGATGMASLTMRNTSRGWMQSEQFYLR